MSEIIKAQTKDWSFTTLLILFMIITYPFMKISVGENGCGKTIAQNINNKFYHDDIPHLFIDIIVLLFLLKIENAIGSRGMFILFVVSLMLITVIETILVNIYPSIKCSPGLFPVFIAIRAFHAIKTVSNTYIYMFLAVIVGIIINMIHNQTFEYMGDYIGLFVGLLLSLTC